jgi:hypothetical protein
MHEIPPRLNALLAFAKSHTAAPLLSFLGRFKPPPATEEIATQLRALHRWRSSVASATEQLELIDVNIGRRLATDKLHATEVIELKLRLPNEKSAASFDKDAAAMAGAVRHARDVENASTLGLAIAIWLRTELIHRERDLQYVRQEIYSQIHQVFRLLNEQKLLTNPLAIALCQAAWNAHPLRANHPYTSMLLECLRLPGFVAALLQVAPKIEKVQVLLEFACFLIRQEDGYNGFAALSFLERLRNWSEREAIVQKLAAMQFQSAEPITSLPTNFEAFRFPVGLSTETVQAWMNAQNGDELLNCISKLTEPCKKTRIPFLSPDAQKLSYYAERTLRSSASRSDDLSLEEYQQRWGNFLRAIAGIQLSRESVQSRFISIVSNESRLKPLLRQSQRTKLIQKIAGDGTDRENWVLAKLLQAAGAMSAEDYSMCSICLGSAYLYDIEGRFCNRKTFRDFAAFIDRDIQNLRAFIDPAVAEQAVAPGRSDSTERASSGHVKRLMSFVRDFLIDPQNAHYTNFEVYRTKPFSQK